MRWKLVVGIVGGVALLCCGGAGAAIGTAWTRADTDTVGAVDFRNAVRVPPLATSRTDGDGRRVFDLTARAGRHDFGGRTATTWGFDGAYLGPTLRAKRGERVVVNVRNELAETTTVHWHGMHLPAVMDGGPHQVVTPGETWSPTWRIDQPAATLWYHPHLHGATADHVYRGLAGLFLIDDDTAPGLPARYGVDDVPLVLQDKSFDGDGLDNGGAFLSDVGVLGDEMLVNGVRAPYLDVRTELVRLRLLNAGNARTLNLVFADARPFDLVATDGGLLDRPHRLTGLLLSPGERAEVVVRVRPGERAVLRSERPDRHPDGFQGRFQGGSDRFDILQVRAAGTLEPSPPLPAAFGPVDLPDPAQAVRTRTFDLSGTRINGANMDLGRIDVAATRGTTEIWEVRNRDGSPHNFHVHDVQVRVIDPVSPALSGRKDTVFATPGQVLRLAVRFDGPADPNVPYMYHCHVLRHEDNGMMGQFVVVEPGQRPGTPPRARHDHD
ncbi:multicopper oxidase family protein [Spirilliplanes yamanashiensis]|uniref:Multicopper oxidase n=2 Tax=Spirilliplanes yamanashiensis TaxID=42233 RepID=A0A8J3Y792_9ACTN|nr:multicopper oxidase domain-containing protein [Spirilliplanes yamanashiensis]MDP9814971.1 FtsP/CotA-like multicopper oxidase with cupredoxin domain [Spirilliplanes yamanashiensis]GIJ02627.1 multicopper oxidase [Spirilliplanes yamanashiensis]